MMSVRKDNTTVIIMDGVPTMMVASVRVSSVISKVENLLPLIAGPIVSDIT